MLLICVQNLFTRITKSIDMANENFQKEAMHWHVGKIIKIFLDETPAKISVFTFCLFTGCVSL